MSADDDREPTYVDPRVTRLSLPALDLVVIEGSEAGARVPVRQRAVRIGAAEGCDLRLADPRVSRVHAEVSLERGATRIVDHDSTNGTFVDGVRVSVAWLAPGATVRIGQTVLRAEPAGEPLEIALSSRTSLGGLLGASAEMRRVYAVAERVAKTPTTVLIQGETGTGKEVLARALHELSERAGPFVAVDCGAIPESLAESELFGHVRGAFSGAVADRRGVFEEAAGGTLFLDEIGEITQPLQRKLLRALETREIRRVGASTGRPVDVRVVAATNRPLAAAVNEGAFREDLYHRLAVVVIALPPLRQRRDDIPLLARHFHERFQPGGPPIPQPLLWSLTARSWPGNVRELRNTVERAVALGPSALSASASAAPAELDAISGLVPVHLPFKEARDAWATRFEEAYVRAMLARTGGNVSQAARDSGISRRLFQRVMVRLGMRDDEPE